jgi:hypothetical protein
MTLDPKAAADTRTPEQVEIDRLRSELDHFIKSGIIEIAVRNPSVAEYMLHWEERALQAESALASAGAGDGLRLVPVEPTNAMCVAGWKKAEERDAVLGNGEIAMIYHAMLAAAPLNEEVKPPVNRGDNGQ